MIGDGKSWHKLFLFFRRMCEDIKGRKLTRRELVIARKKFLDMTYDDLEKCLNKRKLPRRFIGNRRRNK